MSKKEIDNALENQIGHIGGAEETPQMTNQKLKYNHTGQQGLDEEEQASLNKFLNKANNRDESVSADIRDGWIPLPLEELGERAQFYPETWSFRIKPASVEAIKNWSSIDETRPDSINRVFNEMLKSCVTVVTPDGTIGAGKINTWDRFWFILKIREYTFSKGQLNFTEDCPECGESLTYQLNANSLTFEYPDKDIVEKYYDRDTRSWVIDPSEYDIPEEEITLYNPTIEKEDAIFNNLVEKVRNNNNLKVNESFIKFSPWLLTRALKEPKLFDNALKGAEKRYKSWDVDMFQFMDDVLRNIEVKPLQVLKTKCNHCGEEVYSSNQFLTDIKSLFTNEGGHKKFGTK